MNYLPNIATKQLFYYHSFDFILEIQVFNSQKYSFKSNHRFVVKSSEIHNFLANQIVLRFLFEIYNCLFYIQATRLNIYFLWSKINTRLQTTAKSAEFNNCVLVFIPRYIYNNFFEWKFFLLITNVQKRKLLFF